MKKRSGTRRKRIEPPAEIDFGKARFIGFGLDALDRYEAEKARTLVLDEDVAKVFRDAKSVNSVLRAFIDAITPKTGKRKSA